MTIASASPADAEIPPDDEAPADAEVAPVAAVRAGPGTPRRRVRGIAGPVSSVVLAAGICWWAVRGVDRDAVADAVGDANLALLVGAAVGYFAVFYAVETVGFFLAYRRHLVAEVPRRHVAVIIGGKHALGAVWPMLTKAVAPLYFRRRWAVPVLRSVGTSEVVAFADGISTLLLLSCAIVIGEDRLPAPMVAGFVGWWLLVVAYVGWAWTPWARKPRWMRWLRTTSLLSAFARTTPRELAVQVVIRFCLAVSTLVTVHVLLSELGHGLAFGHLLLLGPPLLGATLMSIGGYGGPQGVAVLLLVEVWHEASRAEAVAFSLVWSTMFLVGRLLVGAPLLIPLLRLVRRRAA